MAKSPVDAVDAVDSRPRKASPPSIRSRLARGRRLRLTRNHLVVAALVVVAFWVLLGFARTITQLNSATDRQTALTDETAALVAQLEASERELELVQTDGFQAMQARAYGIGAPNEIVFSLEPGAPSPEPVIALGSEGPGDAAQTPLDAWLRLLFGD
jgi:cell division protein FtsB